MKNNVTSPKEPMSNAVTPLCSPKYSPNGSGASKSEGPIKSSDKPCCK